MLRVIGDRLVESQDVEHQLCDNKQRTTSKEKP